MALQLPPDLEERVAALARAQGREPASVLADIVGNALDEAYDEAVDAGLGELDRGEGLANEEAMGRMRAAVERRFGPRTQ